MRPARLVLFVLGAAVAALAAGGWRTSAQDRRPSDGSPVQLATGNRAAQPADPDDRGATFYWLESQIVRQTTKFGDAVAIAERAADGDLRTRLTDRAGNPLATFTVDRVGAMSDVLEYRGQQGARVGAAGPANLRPTLAWANHQAYRLWKEVNGPDTPPLEWRGRLMRPRGARAHDPDADVAEVHAEWASGFATRVTRAEGTRRHAITGRPLRGRLLTGRLIRDGVELGHSQWYADEKVYAWSFPGLTEGYVDEDRLAEVGGWTFAPDLEWVGVQSYAFHYFHSQMAAAQSPAGAVPSIAAAASGASRAGAAAVARATPAHWLQKAVAFFSPTLSANDVGCDGLHWLDGSAFRPCCDGHDRCYEKNGCSYKSWWMWWSSWRCDLCNLYVVTCFVTGGRAPFQQSPY